MYNASKFGPPSDPLLSPDLIGGSVSMEDQQKYGKSKGKF